MKSHRLRKRRAHRTIIVASRVRLGPGNIYVGENPGVTPGRSTTGIRTWVGGLHGRSAHHCAMNALAIKFMYFCYAIMEIGYSHVKKSCDGTNSIKCRGILNRHIAYLILPKNSLRYITKKIPYNLLRFICISWACLDTISRWLALLLVAGRENHEESRS
jgi:hypothetical protein